MAEQPAGEPVSAVRPGDSPEDVGRFFDHAIGEVYPYLLRRCGHVRVTAEDLTQDTFMTAVRALGDGRVDQLTVGWLITCAQSRFIDHCRRASREERHLHSVLAEPPDLVEDRVVVGAVVTELLSELPAAQRLDVVLHHLDGLPVAEIAARTDRSVRAVESSLARARRTLRTLTEGDSHDS